MKPNHDYFENPETDEDFIQIATDVYGSEIRDNSRIEKIEIGRNYHLTGEE